MNIEEIIRAAETLDANDRRYLAREKGVTCGKCDGCGEDLYDLSDEDYLAEEWCPSCGAIYIWLRRNH